MARAAEGSGVAAGIRVSGLEQRYGSTRALDAVTFEVSVGRIIGIVGPDGAGKSTLLGVLAGARKLQLGRVEVLGCDLRRRAERKRAASLLAYMPQGLGANLYDGLSVRENLSYFAALFRIPRDQAAVRAARLLEATGLTSVAARRAGQLSGGMQQKLGLACALVHAPRLVILDEPTTGVDPLSRRAFWDLLSSLRESDPQLTVVVATAYMEEAEPFDDLVLFDGGRVLAQGSATALRRATATASLEDAYTRLLERVPRDALDPDLTRPAQPPVRSHSVPRRSSHAGAVQTRVAAVEACELSRRFGKVLAVDGVSFRVEPGEIFGFVGPNGSGKTTTLKMLTAILPPTRGEVRVLGERVSGRSLEQRRLAGYMSQRFSLYTELTAAENLRFQGRLLDVPRRTLLTRCEELAVRFGLRELLDQRAGAIPLGMRQRLALAAAMIHEPKLLVLDEPTSGVDPVARAVFWETIESLARDDGVTMLVSTHYLNEASRCDRVALMNEGRLLGCETPEQLARASGEETLAGAFAAYIRADLEQAGGRLRGERP